MEYSENFKLDDKLRNLVGDNLGKLKKNLLDNDISIFFVPSPRLREVVAKQEDPIVMQLPQKMQELILSGVPFAIQKRMVYDLLTGKLDKRNAFILTNGDIKILEGNESLLNLEGGKNGH